jgi:hypothetical protein
MAAANGSTIADNSWDGWEPKVIVDASATASVTVTYVSGTKVVAPGNYATFKYRRSKGGYIAAGSGAL